MAILTASAFALALTACGSSSSTTASHGVGAVKGVQTPQTQALSGGKRGGTLTVLDHEDFETLDPGVSYAALGYQVVRVVQRPLYSYRPNDFSHPIPDMASDPPEISSDRKTVTVHIRQGVHFSPPVNREATSADVAYAIERGQTRTSQTPTSGPTSARWRARARPTAARSQASPRPTPTRSSSI